MCRLEICKHFSRVITTSNIIGLFYLTAPMKIYRFLYTLLINTLIVMATIINSRYQLLNSLSFEFCEMVTVISGYLLVSSNVVLSFIDRNRLFSLIERIDQIYNRDDLRKQKLSVDAAFDKFNKILKRKLALILALHILEVLMTVAVEDVNFIECLFLTGPYLYFLLNTLIPIKFLEGLLIVCDELYDSLSEDISLIGTKSFWHIKKFNGFPNFVRSHYVICKLANDSCKILGVQNTLSMFYSYYCLLNMSNLVVRLFQDSSLNLNHTLKIIYVGSFWSIYHIHNTISSLLLINKTKKKVNTIFLIIDGFSLDLCYFNK